MVIISIFCIIFIGGIIMKVIGFNKPTGDNGYLSIYYQAPFYQDGLRFETVEQCFLYQKALTFHDEYRCKKILQTFDSKILNQLVKDIVNCVLI